MEEKQKQTRTVITLPFVEKYNEEAPRPINRAIKVRNYQHFAKHLGHTFTIQCVYNQVKAKKVQHRVIDGGIYVILKPAAVKKYRQFSIEFFEK